MCYSSNGYMPLHKYSYSARDLMYLTASIQGF